MGWEEEFYWKRPWNPPAELLANYQKDASPLPVSSSRESAGRHTGTAFMQPATRSHQSYQPQTLQPQQPLSYQQGKKKIQL